MTNENKILKINMSSLYGRCLSDAIDPEKMKRNINHVYGKTGERPQERHKSTCHTCMGRGEYFNGLLREWRPCIDCNGLGYTIAE